MPKLAIWIHGPVSPQILLIVGALDDAERRAYIDEMDDSLRLHSTIEH